MIHQMLQLLALWSTPILSLFSMPVPPKPTFCYGPFVRHARYALRCQTETHKSLMYQQCKALIVSVRKFVQMMQHDLLSKARKCQEGWRLWEECKVTHGHKPTQETRICVPFKSKHHQSFPTPNQVGFVSKRTHSCIDHALWNKICRPFGSSTDDTGPVGSVGDDSLSYRYMRVVECMTNMSAGCLSLLFSPDGYLDLLCQLEM